MPMYNLLNYSGNYSMASGNLWNYYKGKVNDSDWTIQLNNSLDSPFQRLLEGSTTGAKFHINIAKRYVQTVTFVYKWWNQFFGNIKQWFKITSSSNKCWCEITTQAKNNSLDFMIYPTFRNINWLLVNLFKNGDDDW